LDSNLLERLRARGLLDWATLRTGLEECRTGQRAVRLDDVCDFAIASIASIPDALTETCGRLIEADALGTEEALPLLDRLAGHHGQSLESARRKWRAVALEALLEQLGDDPLYDLLHLGDFWDIWNISGHPGPHVVQGVGNTLTPSEYYNPGMLAQILVAHREWLAREFYELRE
jgi:hypothetical protein